MEIQFWGPRGFLWKFKVFVFGVWGIGREAWDEGGCQNYDPFLDP